MKVIYTTSATSQGGRDGRVRSTDGILDFQLTRPKEMGGNGEGTNPEELFAAGYSACFLSALNRVMKLKHVESGDPTVTVYISIGTIEDGHFQLSAKIETVIPGIDTGLAQELVEKAHTVCPYSRATKGNIETELVVKSEYVHNGIREALKP